MRFNLKTTTSFALLLIAGAATLALSPDLAFGLQGTSPNHQMFEVTFTKWITGTSPSGTFLMAGLTGGDAPGSFSGEVLDRKVSTDGRTTLLHPVYEVISGNRSFTALIRGGQNSTGLGLLDGVILEGWRTGARVHVEFQRMTDCYGAPPGTCFQGTIRILPDSQP